MKTVKLLKNGTIKISAMADGTKLDLVDALLSSVANFGEKSEYEIINTLNIKRCNRIKTKLVQVVDLIS